MANPKKRSHFRGLIENELHLASGISSASMVMLSIVSHNLTFGRALMVVLDMASELFHSLAEDSQVS